MGECFVGTDIAQKSVNSKPNICCIVGIAIQTGLKPLPPCTAQACSWWLHLKRRVNHTKLRRCPMDQALASYRSLP